jgi:hypothetical protein
MPKRLRAAPHRSAWSSASATSWAQTTISRRLVRWPAMTQRCRQRTLQRHHRAQRDDSHQDQCDHDRQCALPHDLRAHTKAEQRAQRDQQDSLWRNVLSVPLLSQLVLVVHVRRRGAPSKVPTEREEFVGGEMTMDSARSWLPVRFSLNSKLKTPPPSPPCHSYPPPHASPADTPCTP